MIVFAFLLALGLVTLTVLAVAAVSLAREGARLASTIAAFQREVGPLLEEIRRDADEATRRLESLGPEGSPHEQSTDGPAGTPRG